MSITRSVFSCTYKRNRYTLKAGATLERTFADARYAVRYLYARQAVAITERIIADARYAVRDLYARQAGAIIERQFADARSSRYYNCF